MRKFLLLIIGLSVHSLSIADWKIDKHLDTMTDEIKKTAIVKNELGHTFSIYRISKGGPVWENFALPNGTLDQLDWEIPLIYRIDKNKATDLANHKRVQEMGVGIHAYEWKPKWINFLMWHGKEDEGIAEDIVQLMEGQKVAFRYYLSAGGYKETSFTLKGAASAISGTIGIGER
uniref:Uncharacterized protein n=1 Tax=Candidatus Kentrum sp. LPFa TaxID=2126335 RepID=A0A450XH28_9GAMM|nr:MAG: hypothetical protein BECKLPF1236A_GA0070988_1007011 [Candidatus Kentron sp. LPFa]VFK28601.1 MAG: hypothetical protein BECKLPF1236C_GA0070990_1006911 [Candidatus Kentron sp. LPFa]